MPAKAHCEFLVNFEISDGKYLGKLGRRTSLPSIFGPNFREILRNSVSNFESFFRNFFEQKNFRAMLKHSDSRFTKFLHNSARVF